MFHSVTFACLGSLITIWPISDLFYQLRELHVVNTEETLLNAKPNAGCSCGDIDAHHAQVSDLIP